MSFSIVDSCSGCGRCLAVCEPNAISGTEGKAHSIDARHCIDCGACAIVCCEGAVRDERGERFEIEGLCGSIPVRAIVRAKDCTGCGDCVASCLFNAIVRVLGTACDAHAHIIDGRCTGCGVCQLECDKGAIDLVGTGEEPQG